LAGTRTVFMKGCCCV